MALGASCELVRRTYMAVVCVVPRLVPSRCVWLVVVRSMCADVGGRLYGLLLGSISRCLILLFIGSLGYSTVYVWLLGFVGMRMSRAGLATGTGEGWRSVGVRLF